MNNTDAKTQEFGKLSIGHKFFLGNPVGLAETAYYIKVQSQKNDNGSWVNAKSAFGMPTFVQYDKRVWVK